jgi:hypothetical protein
LHSLTGASGSGALSWRENCLKRVREVRSLTYATTSFCEPESLPGFHLMVYDRASREGIRRIVR